MLTTKIPLSKLCLNTGQIDGLPANPRQFTKDDITRIAASLYETPELLEMRPLIVTPHEGKYIILAGSLRYCGLKENGQTETDCIVFEGDADKMKEIVIKDNGSFGAWDYDSLANEWDSLPLADWGVPAWKVEDGEEAQEVKKDEFDEDSDIIETKCEKGDIWQLGEHRLMCGDSTNEADVAKLMQGELADICITDPPYGVSYAEKNEFLNRAGKAMSCPRPIENDDKKPQDMYPFWVSAFSLLNKFSKDKMAYYIIAPQGGDLLLLLQAVRDSGFMLKHQIIWNKNNHVLGRCDYNYKHEPIIYGWKINGTHHFVGAGRFKTSVWDVPKPQQSKLHPTMKPVELFSEMMLDNSVAGQIVLDLFGGSGTTLIAAEQLNRKARLIELDSHYCDVIIARWEKLTGKTAIKI